MNIAAGVLLIIASIFNFVGGCTYVVGGGAVAGISEVGSKGHEIALASDPNYADYADPDMESTFNAGKATGAGLMFWGFALLVIACIMIGGAVCSFCKKAKGFVMATAILAILAEVVGVSLTVFGPSNFIGLLAGIFTFIGLRSYNSPVSEPAA